MRGLIFNVVKKTAKKLGGRGLGRIRSLKTLYDFIFTNLQPKIVDVQEHKMYLDSRDKGISRELIISGVYEPFETKLIKSLLKPGMRVVDGGGNVGYYTLIMAQLVGPKGKVYAFEPDPINFSLLKKNVEANGYDNISLINKAVSDKAGREKLFLSSDNLGGHHLGKRSEYKSYTIVETLTLDKFFGENSMKIDLIKMDVEGSEPKAMKGMRKILKANPGIQLITENGSGSESYLRFLLKRFKVFRIDEGRKKLFRFTEDDMSKALINPPIPGYQNFYCKPKSRN